MKKIISVFLCLVLTMSSLSCLGADKNVLEEKLAVVKSRIGDTSEYKEFSSNLTTFENGSYSCLYFWENNEPYKRLEVSINDNDIITRYYKTGEMNVNNTPLFDYKSNEEIIAAAKGFFALLNPDLKDKFIFETQEYADLYSSSYVVYGKRVENGIIVKNNTCVITLSKDLTELTNFRMNFTDIENFEAASGVIGYEEAVNSYKNKLGYHLVYEFDYNSKNRSAVLRYIPNYESTKYIDALNGEVFDYSQYLEELLEDAENTTADKMMSAGGGGGGMNYTEAEIAEINKIENILSLEQIEQMLKSNKYLEISSDAKITFSNLNKDYYNSELYTYFLNIDNSSEFCYVTCDAKTGEVISFSRYVERDYKTVIEEIDAKELENKAKSYAKGLASEYFTDDEMNTLVFNDNNNQPTNNISAHRLVNGVKCMMNGLKLRVNKYDGKIEHYSLSYFDIEFPDISSVISSEQAYDILFENIKYETEYLPVADGNGRYNGKLVYDFGNSNLNMDAQTGKLIYAASDEKEKITEYKDIEGHYAEDVIKKLAKFGIGFTGGEFKPDEVIKQGEFVTLLSYVFRKHGTPIIYKTRTDFSSAYSFIRNKNIILEDEIDENAEVTREDACIMMIKAMGHGEIAQFDKIYVSSFADVEDNVGYIAILNAMNIVSGDGNGNFSPKKTLSRADAILMLYNYLVK